MDAHTTTDAADIHSEAGIESTKKSRADFRVLVLGCLGVVYGDIGTSPLYAFREAAHLTVHDGDLLPTDIYGILSLIIWALIIIVTIKYVLILLRINNRGEGGILSLMSLARRGKGVNARLILAAGVVGAGLFYGDSVITPAISVMSAVEGLKIVSPAFDKAVLPLTMFILMLLCMSQKYGTATVSKFFGPVTALWFFVMAAMGAYWIVQQPEVLWSFSPHYGALFLFEHRELSLAILGTVFLAVTGAEALYADLGHFGRKPIEYAWLRMVFPCLVMNYLGQGALVLHHNKLVESPFFEMVPGYLLLPLVGLAALATIVASQAVITGAYSLSRQAVQLGLLPHLEIRHTSADHQGQIYMPQINKWIFYGVFLLCFVFGSSSEMASAYGISVMGTMLVGTVLAAVVMRRVMQKRLAIVMTFLVIFLIIEGGFFIANIIKVFDGGFASLAIAFFVFMCMWVWMRGTKYLHRRARRHSMALTDLVEQLERQQPAIVDGTAVFLTSDPSLAPLPMLQNLRHNKVFHKKNIVLSVVPSQFPKVPEAQKIMIEPITSSLTRVYVHCGFMETPDVPAALMQAKNMGLDIDLKTLSYFIGHRTVVGHPDRGLPKWQETIYIAMAKSATNATDFYHLPSNRVIEIGIQLQI